MRIHRVCSRSACVLVMAVALLLLGSTASYAWTLTHSVTSNEHTWTVTPGGGEVIKDFHIAFPEVVRSSSSYNVEVVSMPINWKASLSGGGTQKDPGHLYLNFYADVAGGQLTGATEFKIKAHKGFKQSGADNVTCIATLDGDEDQATGRIEGDAGNPNPRGGLGPVVYHKSPSMTLYGLIALVLMLGMTAVWMYRRKAVAVA